MANWQFLTLFALLQVADIVTTDFALAKPGNWEANPAIHQFQLQFGSAWWIPKIAAVSLSALISLNLRARWPLKLVLTYYIVIVLGNSLCL